MACVTKRRGKWILDYRDAHGKRHWETTDLSKKEAQLLLAQRLQEIHRGEYQVRSEEKTFAELTKAYQDGHVTVNVRKSTRRGYEAIIRLYLLPYFDGVKARSITPEMFEVFRAKLIKDGVGRRTINKCHTLLGSILRYGMRHRWISYNAAAEVKKLQPAEEHESGPIDESILTPIEVQRLLTAADKRWYTLLLMAVSTGLRQGELLGLKWGDIDRAAKEVHVRRQYTDGRFSELKTKNSRRRIGLSEQLLVALQKWKLKCPKGILDLVFPNGAGNPENHGNLLRRGFYPSLRRAKLRQVRFHDLRHTFASFLIAKNVHPKRIQALMGHSSIKVTMDVYGHLMKDADNEAAEQIADLIFGSKMVATGKKILRNVSQVIDHKVARDRIELPTRGFSVPCSTD